MRKKYYVFPRKFYKEAEINSTIQQNSLCLNVLRTLGKDKPSSGMELPSTSQHLVQWWFKEQSY